MYAGVPRGSIALRRAKSRTHSTQPASMIKPVIGKVSTSEAYQLQGSSSTNGLGVELLLRARHTERRPNNRVHRSAASEFLIVPSVLHAAPGDAGR